MNVVLMCFFFFLSLCVCVLQKQLEEAEELAKQQSETVTTHHKKFEMIDKLTHDGVAQELAGRYNMKCGPPYR